MSIDEKMIAAVNDILSTYDADHIFTRQELVDLIHSKFGIHKASILPSDYCYNRTNNGVRASTPKLFLHMGRGMYKCVGPNYAYNGPVQHHPRSKRQNMSEPIPKSFDINHKKYVSTDNSRTLAQICTELFDLSNAKLSDAYYYSALPLCIIDAVFSIGVTYTSTQNTVLRYCAHVDIPPYDRHRAESICGHSVSDLIAKLDALGIENSADVIFQNRQRTSARNGILKAEAVCRFAKVLQENNIENFSDLYAANDLTPIYDSIKEIPGQKSGLSWQYFLMLSGDDTLAKPDRHVLRFIEKHLGLRPSVPQAQIILTDTVNILSATYPNITVRLLDYTIWEASAHNKL